MGQLIMRLFSIVLTLLVSAVCGNAGERETRYFQENCLPLVRDFVRRNNLPLDPAFPTNRITHWKVEFPEPPVRRHNSRMMLEHRYAFFFVGDDSTNTLRTFQDNGSVFRRLLDPSKETEMRAVAARTNLLNEASALALIREYFRLQGHDENNFHPVHFKQTVWAWAIPSRRIVLPFYEAEWARKDVKLPVEQNESLYPNVQIIVSGLDSNLVYYSKIMMPLRFGQDWETNRIEKGRPNRPPVP